MNRNRVEPVNRKRKKTHTTANVVLISHLPLIRIEKGLESLGRFLSRKHVTVIIVSLFILAALCLGFVRIRNEENPPRLYEDNNSQSRRKFAEARRAFPAINAWTVTIHFIAKSELNVLSSRCLKDVVRVHNSVTNSSYFPAHCIMKGEGICATTSPLILEGLKIEGLEMFTARKQNNNSQVLKLNEAIRLHNISVIRNVSVQGLSVVYLIRRPENSKERSELKDWIEKMTSTVRDLRSKMQYADATILDITANEDKVWAILLLEQLPMLYAIPIVLFTLLIIVVFRSNCTMSLVVFPLVVFCVCISFISAFGVCSMFGIAFQELYIIVPCFMLIKSFTDALLLLRSLRRVSHLASPARRASSCMTSAGLIVLTTTLMNIIVFGVPIWSSFKGISHLFVFALVSVILTYFTTLAVFLTSLLWLTKKSPDKLLSSTCRPQSTRRQTLCLGKKPLTQKWVNLVTSIPAKIFLALLMVALVGLSVYVIAAHNARFRTVDFFYKGSTSTNSKVPANDTPKLHPEDVTILFKESLNYSSQAIRSHLINLSSKLNNLYNRNRTASNWIVSFEKWTEKNRKRCIGNTFHSCLEEFLNHTLTSLYRDDLQITQSLNNEPRIKASRTSIPIKFTSDIFKDISTMESLENEIKKSSVGKSVKPVSSIFLGLQDFKTFLHETLYVFIILAVAITICVFPLTSSMRTPFVLLFTFLMLCMEGLAVMFVFEVPFNQISFSCIFPAVVLSFNMSLYVAEAFIISKETKSKMRITDAVESSCISLLCSCFLFIVISIALGFGFPYLSVIFKQVIPVIVVLGAAHAFIFLPFILSTYGKLTQRFGHSSLEMSSFIARGFRKRNKTTCFVVKETTATSPPKFPSISIIGIGCRFPQAPNKDQFWKMLVDGRSCISSFPENRPEEFKQFTENYHPKRFVPGRMCTLGGGYLEDVKLFDAGFFGISPQEANSMDPQQKILLEVAFEAIEDSGMKLEDLQTCKTGVFVGLMNRDYGDLLTQESNLRNMDQFASTGSAPSIMSNRLSFCFNFTGPSFTVDTACSSSLISLKLAVDSLRNGDCEAALVCAPNLILSHAVHMMTSIAGLLAPDGRCKSFDAAGDGYGRGEGFAAVIIKLSEEAIKDRDDIYCEVIACGMNNDGANAAPITAPSSHSQADLFKTVLKRSGVKADDMDYIEAHGTGTVIGDAVETTSISEAYCNETNDSKKVLRIGSVKSNLNHTESAAGLAGLVKLALMIKHGKFVPTVNINQLNPKLKLTEKGLFVQQTYEPWIRNNGKPRIGAVNSYGFGGSNAHVILREVQPTASIEDLSPKNDYCNGTNIITLSARSLDALKDSAGIHSQWLLKNEHLSARDICFSLNERRTVHSHRLAIAFEELDEAVKLLNAFQSDQQGWEKEVSVGKRESGSQKVLFMFGGQGAQWYAMGRELIEKEPIVSEAILQIDKILKELGEKWSLKEELLASAQNSNVNELVVGQVATFSIQYAVARFLISLGVYPSAVVGHSLGEFAAACISGTLTLKETLKTVLLRAKLQSKCPENGSMAALGMAADDAQRLLEELKLEATVCIAAFNDAKSVTLSGDEESIESFGDYLTVNDIKVFWKVLNTSRAFHSRHMVPIETYFKDSAQIENFKPQTTTIEFYSTVQGDVVPGKELDYSYWWKNIRNPVKFHQAIKSALSDGYRKIIEISAQPTLAHYVKQITSQEEINDADKPIVIPTLPRKSVRDQHKAFMKNTICTLTTLGYPIQWHRVRGQDPCRFIRPPTYPWQEQEYWYRKKAPEKNVLPLEPAGKIPQGFPKGMNSFLGEVMNTQRFSGLSCSGIEIDLHRFSFLKDHALTQGGAIMPGAGYIEMAFAMAKDRFLCSSMELHDVKLWSLLTLPESQVRLIRMRLTKKHKLEEATFQITSVQDNQGELLLSSGKISYDVRMVESKPDSSASCFGDIDHLGQNVKSLQERMTEVPLEEFNDITRRYGFSYGPSFSIIKRVWRGENEGLCLIDINNDNFDVQDLDKYVIHPSVLDACLQSCFVPISGSELSDRSIVPVGFKRIQLASCRIQSKAVCHVVMDAKKFGFFDVTLMSLSGKTILKMSDFQVAELTSMTQDDQQSLQEIIYEIQWKETPQQTASQPLELSNTIFVVLKDSRRLSDIFILSMTKREVEVFEVELPETRNFTSDEENGVQQTLQAAMERSVSCGKSLNVISFWPMEADLLQEGLNTLDQAQNIAFRSSVFVIKTMTNSIADLSGTHITLITQGTQFITKKKGALKEHPMPWSSMIWGLRRTASLENANISLTAVDLSFETPEQDIHLLVKHLESGNTEEELAFRGNKAFTNQIERSSVDMVREDEESTESNDRHVGENFFLEQNPTTREIMCRKEMLSKRNGDEAEVKLCYLFSTDDSISTFTKGSGHFVGFSGCVVQSSHRFKVGDEVFGLTRPSRVGKWMKIKEAHLIAKPQEMSLHQSATIPLCFVLAFQIVQKAALQFGIAARILIHEADSNLGFMAAFVAVTQGHTVYCTANKEGTGTKGKLLVDIGVETISDLSCIEVSEKYDECFDAVIFIATPRPGSLQCSCRTIKPKGRLVMACDDVNGDIILPGHKCIKYERLQPVDIVNSPASFHSLWSECRDVLLVNGSMIDRITSMPQQVTNLFEAVEQWNCSSCGEEMDEHITNQPPEMFRCYTFDGKDKPKVILPGIDHFGLKGNRTYIVAGGVRGFGFEVARWMCENGANTVVILARSAASQEKHQEVAELQKITGSNVLILQVDLSSEDHVASLGRKLQDLPSVAGIVHTAMVLRDNLISLMDIDSFRDVMAPKVTGGYLLHKLSLEMDLDFFVMFSSMSSMVGNIGQASYAAANAFLDALASYRRYVLGLPGLSINWGPIGGAGILARDDRIAKLLATAGFGLISATEGPKHMAKVCCDQPSRSQIGVFVAEWPVFLRSNQHLSRSGRFESLRNENLAAKSKENSNSSLASRILLEKDESKRLSMIEEFTKTMLASWAGLESMTEVDFNTSLYNYGIDSTAALTLKMQLESSLQISFEVFYFMQPDVTPSKMVQDISERISNRYAKPEDQEKTHNADIVDSNPKDQKENSTTPENNTEEVVQRDKASIQAIPLYKPDKAEMKFFCIHPSHRYAMSMASIATGFKIQDFVSFYAIGYTEPTERGESWTSVRELAEQYLDVIRKEQKHGPYFLGGYSYGGLVAYEIACLLTEQQEQVAFVGMIDTFPWLPPSRGGYSRLTSWFHKEFSPEKQVELQYEAYLEKVAVQNLKMTLEEYTELKLNNQTRDLIKKLQDRSEQVNVPIYDLVALRESLLHDHKIAADTQEAWEPAAVQYNGHVTYLKCENRKFSPVLPLMDGPDKAWNEVLPGPMDVLICPGDHFSLSELPYARVTGSILATAVSINYRSLSPELYHFDMSYRQRKAINQLKQGVPVLYYSKKARKASKSGTLFLDDDKQVIAFSKGKPDQLLKLKGKVIELKGLRCILAGRYVRNAIRTVAKRSKADFSDRRGGNLYNVVSLFGKKRIYNVEFLSFEMLKEFYHVIEAIFNVKMEVF